MLHLVLLSCLLCFLPAGVVRAKDISSFASKIDENKTNLLNKILEQDAVGGNTITLLGTGKPLRQFIYSLDIAECIYHLVFNYQDTKSVILSVGEADEVSIKYVALSIAKHMDYSNVQFQTEFSDGQYKKTVNNDYLVSLMPSDFKFTSLDDLSSILE